MQNPSNRDNLNNVQPARAPMMTAAPCRVESCPAALSRAQKLSGRETPRLQHQLNLNI